LSGTTAWRFLTDHGAGAAAGLALDEALAAGQGRGGEGPGSGVSPERLPPALRLYSYRGAALVGRYQHLAAEVDVDGCRRTGTEWNRRPTGGGAIVMGPGQLGVAVAVPAPAHDHPRELLARFAGGITTTLAHLGIDARLTGKNDLSVGKRKIAGLGLYLDPGGGLLFHASVLADLDIAFMLSVLRVPAAKLADKAVAAVAERVTTVSAETGVATSATDLVAPVAAGFAEALGVVLEPAGPSPAETARAAALVDERYGTEEWWSERSPQDDATGSAVLKTPEGLVRCYLALHGPTIKSALFAGDFSVAPEPLVRFEAALRWSRGDETSLRTLAATTFAGGTDLGVEAEAIVACVLEAAERARARGAPGDGAVAAPARDAGSCYFPDLSDAAHPDPGSGVSPKAEGSGVSPKTTADPIPTRR
jgi:lipoate-protein ligase A